MQNEINPETSPCCENKETVAPTVTAETPVIVPKGKPHDPSYYRDVPEYMVSVYDWAYVDPVCVKRLDRNLVVWVLLFLNAGRLMSRYLNLVQPGMRVWQAAHVYGSLVTEVADKVGPTGEFHLTDCTPAQLEQAHIKLTNRPWVTIARSDAAKYAVDQPFDLACSFMLLHEVPDDKKREIVDRMLESIGTTGKALFVDYHNPKWYWQPFRTILQLVNHYLEPFSDALWKNDIKSYASHPEDYDWQKETIFGGVYQSIVVTPKKKI